MEDLIRERLARYTDLGPMAIEDVIRQTLIALNLDDREPREMLTQSELDTLLEEAANDAAERAERIGYMMALEDVRDSDTMVQTGRVSESVLDDLAAEYLDKH